MHHEGDGAMNDTETYELHKLDAEVYLIGEASLGDERALKIIKDWVVRSASERGAGVLFMNDSIAVVELPAIITITDPASREMLGLSPLLTPPPHFADRDEDQP